MSTPRSTVVYDGECRFCISQVERIKSMDRDNQFDYMPRQAPEFAARFPALKAMDLEEGMRFVDPDGNIFIAADAVYQIARRLPGPRLIAWLYLIPGLKQIAQLVYRLIAANRKRLGKTCENNVCKVGAEPDAKV